MAVSDREPTVFNGSVIWSRVVDPDTGDRFSIAVDPKREIYVTTPVPEDLDRYYTTNYHGNRHGFTAKYCDWRRSRIMRRAISRIESSASGLQKSTENASLKSTSYLSPEVKWLDVGCGDGTLLQRMAGHGWKVRGVERFPRMARERGLTVFESLEQARGDGPYDGVSLWHVLEHLPDPFQALTDIRGLLKPEGVLIIAVPDAVCFAARWFGPHWLHWDVPRHLFHFSSDSLNRLLGECGFESRHLAISEVEYDLMGFVQSGLNQLGMQQNLFFKLLTGRREPLSPWTKFLHWVMGAFVGVVAAIPVWLCGRLGRGGTLVFEARPTTEQNSN